jgi:hypothetical protein
MELTKSEILELISSYNHESRYAKNKGILDTAGKNIRDKGYLNRDEFLMITHWKSPRSIRKVELNSNEVIKEITKLVFKTNNEEVKIRILNSLDGIGIPIASAILTIPYPEKYGIIDVRAWQTLFDYSKKSFNIKDWLSYLDKIREWGNKFDLSPRDIDKALFMYDQKHRVGNLYK